MSIAQLLSDRLAKFGETQAAMAKRLGVSPQTLNQLIQGNIKVPTADVRRRLAREFNLRHVDILVMVGEIAADEIDSPARTTPFDSERAALIALLETDLNEGDAHVLRATAKAILEERESRKVATERTPDLAGVS